MASLDGAASVSGSRMAARLAEGVQEKSRAAAEVDSETSTITFFTIVIPGSVGVFAQ